MADQHVAVLAFPFTCHPRVLFDLVRSLAASAPRTHFSFFNTAKSNNSILSTFQSSGHPFPANIQTHNMDDGCVPKGSNMITESKFFLYAFPENFTASMDVAQMETGKRITCVISDGLFSLAVSKIAQQMNVPWIAFWVLAPCALPAYLNLDLIEQHYNVNKAQGHQPGDLILDIVPGLSQMCYLDFPCRDYIEPDHPLFNPAPHIRSIFMIKSITEASAVIMNSYQEINPTMLVDYLKSNFKSLLFLGSLKLSESSSSEDNDDSECLSWLDGQKPASVVYICFGTGAQLPPDELVALAEALEASGYPFLWSINDEFKVHLPNGFIERMKMKGKFVAWAPQKLVLEHSSVGVHVTHCGYNSVLESILGEVPMICRSVWADNHMNAKMIEEVWGVGVRVEGRKFTKIGMMKSLEITFQADKGKQIRESIKNLKKVLVRAAGPDGVATQDFKTLVHMFSSKE